MRPPRRRARSPRRAIVHTPIAAVYHEPLTRANYSVPNVRMATCPPGGRARSGAPTSSLVHDAANRFVRPVRDNRNRESRGGHADVFVRGRGDSYPRAFVRGDLDAARAFPITAAAGHTPQACPSSCSRSRRRRRRSRRRAAPSSGGAGASSRPFFPFTPKRLASLCSSNVMVTRKRCSSSSLSEPWSRTSSSGALISRNSIRLPKTFPSGAIMSKRQRPPTRTSHSCVFVVKPFGPNHFVRCSSFVHAAKTSSRGASKTRDSTISRSSDRGPHDFFRP